MNLGNQWHLRINLGNGEYVWAKVIRSAKRKTDKWVGLIKDNGVIGIDINAYPFHLAIVHTAKDGNLEKYDADQLRQAIRGQFRQKSVLELANCASGGRDREKRKKSNRCGDFGKAPKR